MKNINKIETKEEIKFFQRKIKKELKDVLWNVEDNLSGYYGIGLINDVDTHYCHICQMELPRLFQENKDAIGVYDFMWRNGFKLNKNTTDIQLMQVVDKIIDDYNRKVPEKNKEYERDERLERKLINSGEKELLKLLFTKK